MTTASGRWPAALAIALASACGPAPAAPTPPVPPTTVRITTTGMSPKSVDIALGSRVLFVNNDTRSHNMASDPHPEHTDCPQFDQVGLLSPGQSRETGNLVNVRTCGFHDHDSFQTLTLQGSVVIK